MRTKEELAAQLRAENRGDWEGKRIYIYDDAKARVEAEPELAKHRATILADWPREGTEHWRWVVETPIAEIVDWAETVDALQEEVALGEA